MKLFGLIISLQREMSRTPAGLNADNCIIGNVLYILKREIEIKLNECIFLFISVPELRWPWVHVFERPLYPSALGLWSVQWLWRLQWWERMWWAKSLVSFQIIDWRENSKPQCELSSSSWEVSFENDEENLSNNSVWQSFQSYHNIFLWILDSNSRDCYPGEWGCPGSTVCITMDKVCDGKPDCPEGTDETNSTAQQTCGRLHKWMGEIQKNTHNKQMKLHRMLLWIATFSVFAIISTVKIPWLDRTTKTILPKWDLVTWTFHICNTFTSAWVQGF